MLLPSSVIENSFNCKFVVFRCFLDVPCLFENRGAKLLHGWRGFNLWLQCWFRALYGPHYAPNRNTILNTHRKFMETGSVMDRPYSGRPQSGQSEENVAAVWKAFDLSQGKSIRKASAELNISTTSIQRILWHELRLFPYKIQVVQKVEPQDYDSRIEMCEILLGHFQRDPSILEQMWFSDEALSTFLVVLISIIPTYGDFAIPCKLLLLVMYLASTSRWHGPFPGSARRTMDIHKHERDTPKLIILCAISSAGLIGPFFFCDWEGHSVNVKGDNYLRMLQEFCVPKLSAVANMQQVIFQQDGAPVHYLSEVCAFLDEQFPDRWNGRHGPMKWAPRSPDLTPCDFFLWGYIKSNVYGTRPRDLSMLVEHIRTHVLQWLPKCC